MHIRYTELDKKHVLVWITVYKNGISRKAANQSLKEHPSRKTILFLLENKIIKISRGSTFTVEWQTIFLHSNICYTKWKQYLTGHVESKPKFWTTVILKSNLFPLTVYLL